MKVYDLKGFHYEVEVDHLPTHGFATAYYNGRIVAQVDNCRIYPPSSDDDREHEEYEERVAELMDENEGNLQSACKEYFDNNKQFE